MAKKPRKPPAKPSDTRSQPVTNPAASPFAFGRSADAIAYLPPAQPTLDEAGLKSADDILDTIRRAIASNDPHSIVEAISGTSRPSQPTVPQQSASRPMEALAPDAQVRVRAALTRVCASMKSALESLNNSEKLAFFAGLSEPNFLETHPGTDTAAASELPIPPPERAPELWSDRKLELAENPAQFTRRVYALWLGKGLNRRDLRGLDAQLYRALSVWIYRHPDDAIAELPPMSEQTDQMIETLSQQLSLDDLRKLGYAIDKRLKRNNKQ